MRIRKFTWLLAACVLLGSILEVHAQEQKPARNSEESRLDIAVTYQAMLSNPVGSEARFWLQGGSVQLHGQFWRGFGEVADISGEHTGQARSGVGLDLVTATFGPRYTWQKPHQPFSLYGQALVGEAFALNSVFPGPTAATDSANSLALVFGGGVNYRLKHGFSLRALEADWVRTQTPNNASNVQNNLRLGAGLVLHIR